MSEKVKSDQYQEAGVDIDLAQTLFKKVKDKVDAARRPEMVSGVGGFGGLFQLDLSKYRNPVLVSSIDGVGTKLMVAMLMNQFDGIGFDLVNHCVNDIAVQGAEPLYFMDYIGLGELRSPLYEQVVGSMAEACQAANCALLGGETAEMPGMYGDDFDVVGTITGVVERDRLITGEKIADGHMVVALASNGLHTNGYSLARRILFQKCRYSVDTELKELGETIGAALLKPHTCYWPAIKNAMESGIGIDGMVHVTGGGIYDNTPRILPDGLDVLIEKDAVSVPPIISLIVDGGGVSETEAYRVFNMGFGMLWFTSPEDAPKAVESCKKMGVEAAICGQVKTGTGEIVIK